MGLLFFHFLLGYSHRAVLNLIFMFRILGLGSLFPLTSHDENVRWYEGSIDARKLLTLRP